MQRGDHDRGSEAQEAPWDFSAHGEQSARGRIGAFYVGEQVKAAEGVDRGSTRGRRGATYEWARVLAIIASLALYGCDLGTDSGTDAATVAIIPAFVGLDAIGETLELTAEVRNEDGDLLSGAGVSWSAEDQNVVTVSPDGLVTALANGRTRVSASSGGASRTIAVEVAQRAASLQREAGHGQSGAAGQQLGTALVVRALDARGNPASGVLVTFQVERGGGTVSTTEVETDSNGRATTAWTLGEQAGQAQLVRAFVTFRVEASVEFTATAQAGPAAVLLAVSGDNQSAPKLAPLLAPLVVRVEDAIGNPVAGAPVSFTTSHGSLAPADTLTDSLGTARTVWTLGSALGAQTANAVVGSLTPLAFHATATETPGSIEILRGDGQTGTVGQAVTEAPAIRVKDALGNPIPSLDVRFSAPGSLLESATGAPVNDTLVVRTGFDGVAALRDWILGTTPGEYELTVEVPTLAPVTLTATALRGPPTQIVRVAGDGQRGAANAPLPDSLVVRVTDSFGNPAPGVTVTFAPAAGDGTASPTSAITDSNGLAATRWTIAASATAQFLTASIPGASVVFSAGVSGLGGIEIELQYVQLPTPSQEDFFDAATLRWAIAIPGRLTPQLVDVAAGTCGAGSPAINRVVEDLVVVVRIASIDNAFGTLAQAGPCLLRPGGGLPVVAQLTVDAADIGRMQANGTLDELVLHELGHALGFGTLWPVRGLLENPSLPNNRGADTHFDGAYAIAAFDSIGGRGYAGRKVPVENVQQGAGTRDSHWRLTVFENELMTGLMTSSVSPMSRVTVASLRDLGYEVDEDAADPFQIGPFPSPALVEGPTAVSVGDDVLRAPVHVLGPDGRIVRTLD
jgi:5-hydroxyisourate hydrolase-like protein (transthyretin family)